MTEYNLKIFDPLTSIFIGNLDVRVTEKDVKKIVDELCNKQHIPIEGVKIVPKFDSSYAFVNVGVDVYTDNFVDKLNQSDVQLYQRKLHFSLIKSSLGNTDFPKDLKPVTASDEPFDIQPEDPHLPTIHILFDNIFLQVFNCLKGEDLFICAEVCRRFEYLVALTINDALRRYIGGCFKTWLALSNFPDTYDGMRKLLKLCGCTLKKMEIHGTFSDLQRTIHIITEYCPNLEELVLKTGSSILAHYMVLLGEKCTRLKKLIIWGGNILNDSIVHAILSNNRSLEVLEVNCKVEVTRRCFTLTQIPLKEFYCFGKFINYTCERKSPWKKFFVACRQLEVFDVNAILSVNILKDAVRFCPNIKKLSINLGDNVNNFDWFLFPKLLKLSITTRIPIDLSNFVRNDLLEELCILSPRYTSADFIPLRNLKRLTANLSAFTEVVLVNLISNCSNLEFLKFRHASRDRLDDVFFCINNLPKLNTLVCEGVQIIAEDVMKLCSAREEKIIKLNLSIAVDDNVDTAPLIEANYDIHVIELPIPAIALFLGIDDPIFYDDMMEI